MIRWCLNCYLLLANFGQVSTKWFNYLIMVGNFNIMNSKHIYCRCFILCIPTAAVDNSHIVVEHFVHGLIELFFLCHNYTFNRIPSPTECCWKTNQDTYRLHKHIAHPIINLLISAILAYSTCQRFPLLVPNGSDSEWLHRCMRVWANNNTSPWTPHDVTPRSLVV